MPFNRRHLLEGPTMKRKILLGLAVMLCAMLSLAASAPMPEAKIFAQLTSNGTALSGQVSVTSYGGVDVSQDMIEVLSFSWEAAVSKPAAGERVYSPIRFKKRVDQTSPSFAQALADGSHIAGEFRFFEPNPGGGGARHFYSVAIYDARVVKVGNVMVEGETPVEEVELSLGSITIDHVITSTSFSDSVSSK
jgi:type VI secretion system Hcp family effector